MFYVSLIQIIYYKEKVYRIPYTGYRLPSVISHCKMSTRLVHG